VQKINEKIRPVQRPEKILQFGEGGFLRAFVDWMIDILNEKTGFNGNVVIAQPLEHGMGDMLSSQDCLYTTVLRGVRDGRTAEEIRAIRSVSRCVNPYTEYDAYMECAENPDLRFVVSNTTEAGIAPGEGDRLDDRPQKSFPGKVTAFLYRRFRHFRGDPSKALVFIPCELIDKNGAKLREIVMRYCAEWNLGDDFAKWLDACDFCNSLVDRIVSGYPKEEAGALGERIGYEDRLLDAAEIFHLWVIENSRDYSAELPFTQAGLNVIWTADMSFYRTRKVRILNGAHTSSVPAAFLCGLDTVEACVQDPQVRSFMQKAIFEEIIPSMDGDREELKKYAGDVLERFANPYIKHLLLSITLNSVSKFKTRVLPSITGFVKKQGKLPPALCFSMAALIAFYEGADFAGGKLSGRRGDEPYPIADDEPILKEFESLYRNRREKTTDNAEAITRAALGKTAWWGEDLCGIAGFAETTAAHLAAIRQNGMRAAMEKIV
jgi:tagaturonate reductase